MNHSAPAARSPALRAILIVVLLLLGWASLRNAALLLFAQERPALAMAFTPSGAAALANAAQARIVARGGLVDPKARAETARALRMAPRDAAPLILAGLAASADNEVARAQMLMEAARARNPRADIARYWLLDHYVRTGQAAPALAEVGPALRLRPGTREAIFALVSAMAAAPDTHDAVLAELAKGPDWRESFFTTQATANVAPLVLLRLLGSLPHPADPEAAARERRAVLLSAVRAGAYRQAFAVWNATVSAGQRDSGPVQDPGFQRGFDEAPFRWTRPAAGAQPTGGGIAVQYRGHTPAVVAEQLVVATGRYRIALQGKVDAGNVEVRLTCARDEASLAQSAIGRDGIATIPARCGAAWLRIVAVPEETGSDVTARVAAMRMTAA